MTDTNDDGLEFTYGFLGLFLCSVILIFLASSTRFLDAVEQFIALITHPVYVASDLPRVVVETGTLYLSHRESLIEEINALQQEILLQKNINTELTYAHEALLDLQRTTGAYSDERRQYQLVEVIGVNPNTERHQLIVNRGETSRIELGMVVIDAEGVFGQIIEVFNQTAIVLSLNDSKHAIPVLVKRSRYRSIASGNGSHNRLTLENVSVSADIDIGDELITSGLGGRFPKGYNVGTVVSISSGDAQTLLRIEVEPAANLSSSRFLLVGSIKESS